ncbi:MBL fold metallo-hydrolase [bacterium]|nr:MBL fold metallo-hydrolase [bacterium]MDG1892682.1 MBL fold metallo-hydrolase [Verrucomicrobiota bacterium]
MRVQFIGATRTTTGSTYLFEVNGDKILLECGLYQGRREETIERNRKFPFDPSQISAVIISHAHIDHCGNLPNLCRQGFRGNVYCTFATRDLAAIMLADSAHIQQYDADYVSRKRARKGLKPVEALYSVKDAEQAVSQFVAVNYNRPMLIAKGITLTFKDAGHILGSAQVIFDVQEKDRHFRYLFSGDIGRGGHEILRDPEPVEDVDFLQIESTYGGREHGDRLHAKDELAQELQGTLEQGGKVIIPAFSVGRTQLIVYTLHQLTLEGVIPKVPIYVDSPLSVNATEIFRLHPECFNTHIYQFLHEKANPFGMANLTYIRLVEHSRKLNELKDAAIIISASGMCEAGRIRHHLKNNIGKPENMILFVGYCAKNTLGSKIMNGNKSINIFGEPVDVKAKVTTVDAFSGHADRKELSRYVRNLSGRLTKVAVVHGEEEQSLLFSETLRSLLPGAEVTVPERLETLEF